MKRPGPQELDAGLVQFDRTEANLAKLESLWLQIVGHSSGFGKQLTAAEHDDVVRAFADIAAALPAIDGYGVHAIPMSQRDMALLRFEANEVSAPEVVAGAEEEIEEPGRQLAEYRFRFNRARKRIVRDRVLEVVGTIDQLLSSMGRTRSAGGWPSPGEWTGLRSAVAELERLAGDMVPDHPSWSDLRRHMHFAEDVDLRDIIDSDWPSVRAAVEPNLYDDREPIPVDVEDLGDLVKARPTGPVSSRLEWQALDSEDFERLIFELVRTADGYENASWQMKTNAPDRGRDIQVERVIRDALSGTTRHRVIIQCKHWTSRSISLPDLVSCVEAVKLWEPPLVDVLIVATSGRLSQDPVAWVEKRRLERVVPGVEVWADSDLEALLAKRPHLIVQFGLR